MIWMIHKFRDLPLVSKVQILKMLVDEDPDYVDVVNWVMDRFAQGDITKIVVQAASIISTIHRIVFVMKKPKESVALEWDMFFEEDHSETVEGLTEVFLFERLIGQISAKTLKLDVHLYTALAPKRLNESLITKGSATTYIINLSEAEFYNIVAMIPIKKYKVSKKNDGIIVGSEQVFVRLPNWTDVDAMEKMSILGVDVSITSFIGNHVISGKNVANNAFIIPTAIFTENRAVSTINAVSGFNSRMLNKADLVNELHLE
ncbi:unnamed protein product [Caenorhabditis bovis]|uniref:Uncharacterized protein n=1 Tax=Caenorhabditis bovis TaxID=2654633 RepID=A0A8S1FCS5_9PELO|nr:unnamed protein product [Caenorhabditis bovis]